MRVPQDTQLFFFSKGPFRRKDHGEYISSKEDPNQKGCPTLWSLPCMYVEQVPDGLGDHHQFPVQSCIASFES